jgi:hypothetical protein
LLPNFAFRQRRSRDAYDVNAKVKYGETPLYVAVSGGHWDVARLLVRRGARMTLKEIPVALWGRLFTLGQEHLVPVAIVLAALGLAGVAALLHRLSPSFALWRRGIVGAFASLSDPLAMPGWMLVAALAAGFGLGLWRARGQWDTSPILRWTLAGLALGLAADLGYCTLSPAHERALTAKKTRDAEARKREDARDLALLSDPRTPDTVFFETFVSLADRSHPLREAGLRDYLDAYRPHPFWKALVVQGYYNLQLVIPKFSGGGGTARR